GRRPFDGALPAMLDAKRQGPSELPACELDEQPSDLTELCLQLLDPDPRRRPSGESLRRRCEGGSTMLLSPIQGLSENQRGGVVSTVSAGSEPRADGGFPAEGKDSSPERARLFVGRQQELGQLDRAFDVMQAGRSQVVLVEGPSGIGKTTLVNHFLDGLATRQNLLVLRGRCHERESVPYKAMDGLLDTLCRHLETMEAPELSRLLPASLDCLVRLFPSIAQLGAIRDRLGSEAIPDEQREIRRLGTRELRELLSHLAGSRPTVIFVDDLQWGDADSGLLLNDLFDAPDAPRLLFVGCSRHDDRQSGSCLEHLWQPSGAADIVARRQLIHLNPLNETDGQRLVAAVLQEEALGQEGSAAALWRESRGNPYFLLELARQLKLEGGSAGSTDIVGPVDLDTMLQRRVGGLPDRARELLNIIAVAGQPLPMKDLCRAIRTTPEPRVTALLRSEHFIRAAGNRPDAVEIYHDRIRETITGWLTAEDKRGYHARLATTLEGSGAADPEVLCVHFDGAGDRQRATHYGWLAADRAAAALAFDRAAGLYRFVLDHGGFAVSDELRLRRKLADSLASGGRGAEAAEQYAAIAERQTGIEAVELQRLAADQLLRAGHFAEGKKRLGKALRAVGMKLPRSPQQAILSILLLRLRIRLLGGRFRNRPADQISRWKLLQVDTCWSAQTSLGQIDALSGAVFALRHSLLARQLGEPSRVALALGTETCFRTMVMGRQTGRDLRDWQRAEELPSGGQLPFVLGALKAMRASTETFLGHWRRALEFCDEAEASLRLRSTGTHFESSILALNAITCLFFLGRINELSRRIPEILREARQRDDLFAGVVPGTYFGNIIWLATGQVGEARRQAELALAGWPRQPFLMQHMFELIGSASIDLYVGEGPAAWQRIAEAWQDFRGSWHTRHRFPRILVLHLRARSALASVGCGMNDRRLIRSAQRDAKRILREPTGWSQPLARLVLAGIALAEGREDRAIHHLETSVRELDGWEMALYAAAAKRRLGGLMGGRKGREILNAGTEFMTGQGIRSPEEMTRMLCPASHCARPTRAPRDQNRPRGGGGVQTDG
ncbi:MAG: ATP-binding protein, partial [Planctomycetota bacterium]